MSDALLPVILNNGFVQCSSCGSEVLCNDKENSIYFCCVKCDTYFLLKDGKSEKLDVFPRNLLYQPYIPLGAKAKFNDKEYILTGYLVKKDNASSVTWREYLLRHVGQLNYTVLAEYNGHWMILDKAADNNNFAIYKNRYTEQYEVWQSEPFRKYTQYTTYKFTIQALKGEFDWNVADEQEHMYVEEYIAPPEIVVSETFANEDATWYKGYYLQPADVSAAFGMEVNELPRKQGLGAIEPHKLDAQWPIIRKFSLLLIGLIVVTQIMIGLGKPSNYVLDKSYETSADSVAWGGNMAPIKTESFKISGGGAVNVELQTGLSNEWLELPVTMVNEKTGKEYEFTKVAELYSGYEGGESWSEGDPNVDAVFSSVPAGRYHINIYPYSDSKRTFTIYVKVEENTSLYSNFVWLLVLVSVYFIIQYQRKYLVDTERFS